jgi:hypothetical protein
MFLVKLLLIIIVLYILLKYPPAFLALGGHGQPHPPSPPPIYWTFNCEIADCTDEVTPRVVEFFKSATLDIISNSKWLSRYPLKYTENPHQASFYIKILPRSQMDSAPEYAPDGTRIYYSRTWLKRPRRIEIDARNFLEGVPRSKLSPEEYRVYVINHEVGHALGHDHTECQPGEKCSVMHQMTAGIPQGSRPTSQPIPADLARRETL